MLGVPVTEIFSIKVNVLYKMCCIKVNVLYKSKFVLLKKKKKTRATDPSFQNQ